MQHEEHTFPVSAAAIGSGWDANCGTITITGNITSLYAKKGEEEENDHVFSIGSGRDGRCEGVFIGGQQLTFSGRNDNKRQVFDPEVTMHVCNKVHYDTNADGHDITVRSPEE